MQRVLLTGGRAAAAWSWPACSTAPAGALSWRKACAKPIALVAGRRSQLPDPLAQPRSRRRHRRPPPHRPPRTHRPSDSYLRGDFYHRKRTRSSGALLPGLHGEHRDATSAAQQMAVRANRPRTRPSGPADGAADLAGRRAAALASGRDLVFKPVYSRFAAHIVLRPRSAADLPADVTERRPWVAQDYIAGNQVCTYSVAHAGRLTVHSAYRAEFTFGPARRSPSRRWSIPPACAWVEAFVRAEGFTGQIAFDFIETPDGRLFAIECNPRTTSGVHLFAGDPHFPPAFLGEAASSSTAPRTGRDVHGADGGAAAAVAPFGRPVRRWAGAFFGARDVFFRADDPGPFLGQFAALAALSRRPAASRASGGSVHPRYRMEWRSVKTDEPRPGDDSRLRRRRS